jgi:hypothetical protein
MSLIGAPSKVYKLLFKVGKQGLRQHTKGQDHSTLQMQHSHWASTAWSLEGYVVVLLQLLKACISSRWLSSYCIAANRRVARCQGLVTHQTKHGTMQTLSYPVEKCPMVQLLWKGIICSYHGHSNWGLMNVMLLNKLCSQCCSNGIFYCILRFQYPAQLLPT